MPAKIFRLIRTALQAAFTALMVLVIFLLPVCSMSGPSYRIDLMPADQLVGEIGAGASERFAHIALPPPAGDGGDAETTTKEYFGQERKIAGEGDIKPVRRDPEPIGTAAARAALEQTRPVSGGGGRSGGVSAGRGVGLPRDNITYDDGSEQARRAERVAAERQARRNCDEPLAGIRHLGGDRYAVDAVIVEHYTSSLDAVRSIVAVRWYQGDNGRVEGFQMGNIRCGSPLDQLGLRNGDVVLRINGRQVRSLTAAFSALRRLRRSQNVHVELHRRGDRMERFVTIR